MRQPLRILYASAEVAPYSKVGGLADVAGALPIALARLGHQVRVVTPLYGTINMSVHGIGEPVAGATVSFRDKAIPVSFHKAAQRADVEVYFVDCPMFFHRPTIYGERDDLERFLAFSLAVLELPKALHWEPDVFHANDWHTAFTLARLSLLRRETSPSRGRASVYTIHNLQYQGSFPPDWLSSTLGSQDSYEIPRIVQQLGGRWPSMASLAILHADCINTVSETYAREIMAPEFGCELDPLLLQRPSPVVGILNGIDYESFDPATDTHLASPFNAGSLEKREGNKEALQKRVNLPGDAHLPVLGWVNRLAEQKGIEILLTALEHALPDQQFQFVLLGSGDPKYESAVVQLAQRFPRHFAASLKFDDPLARLIYGGADMLVLPSRFEPCGLGQLIGFRYGAVPVVRRTGGLADTVIDCAEDLSSGTGFVFQEYSADALEGTLQRALAAYRDRVGWRRLVQRGMAQDFSWNASAKKYEELYRSALACAGQGR